MIHIHMHIYIYMYTCIIYHVPVAVAFFDPPTPSTCTPVRVPYMALAVKAASRSMSCRYASADASVV